MSNEKMPILFFGHGSPINIIEENDYTKSIERTAQSLALPKAILVVSAHWETDGTFITAMEEPRTIHDFGGFPNELYEIQYKAKGNPELAKSIQEQLKDQDIQLDHSWGLDHGAYAILRWLYPNAEVPVLQLSLDKSKSMREHYELGKTLKELRNQGVLIIGSGNIVHNLRAIDWSRDATPHQWNVEFDEWVRDKINERDFHPLIDDILKSDAGKLSIPTPEHYIPLLYILGASEEEDNLEYIFEGYQNASMSMRSLIFS